MKKYLLWIVCLVVAIFIFNLLVYERRIQGNDMIVINKLTNNARYVRIKKSYDTTPNSKQISLPNSSTVNQQCMDMSKTLDDYMKCSDDSNENH